MERDFSIKNLTLGQLYYLARFHQEYRYQAILEIDRRIPR